MFPFAKPVTYPFDNAVAINCIHVRFFMPHPRSSDPDAFQTNVDGLLIQNAHFLPINSRKHQQNACPCQQQRAIFFHSSHPQLLRLKTLLHLIDQRFPVFLAPRADDGIHNRPIFVDENRSRHRAYTVQTNIIEILCRQ